MRIDRSGGGLQQVGVDTAWPSSASEAAVELPDYLVRHYSWAYLRPLAVWFFDHQPIINSILFGHYRRMMDTTLALIRPAEAGKTLQIASAYGELAPTLARHIEELHLVDVAPIQLEAAARKLEAAGLEAQLSRMNAEYLDYRDDAFDTAAMFMLLHELPPPARRRVLCEALRVLRPGGRLVIAEFGERRRGHPIHRFAPLRWIMQRADPFLDGFWRECLDEVVETCARQLGKPVRREAQEEIFGGFYRVVSYRVDKPS